MSENLQGILTDEEFASMLRIDPKLEGVSKKIMFDLKRHSYTANGSTCLPSCCGMAANYWQDLLPQLGLITNRAYWEDFIMKTSFGTIKGVNLAKIRMNLSPKENNLIFSEKTVKTFADLLPPFEAWKFPFIQIIIYDRMFSFRERTGGGHAAIISQINMNEKSLLLIDPIYYDDENVIVESHIHMRDLAKGWKLFSNAVIWVYPKSIIKSFKVKTNKANITKSLKQENINKYLKL